jgi:LPS sulfotransferase NodH
MSGVGHHRGYLLCASPRSGSTMLCDLLTQTGAAGAPDSFFRPASIPDFAREWGVEPPRDTFGHAYVAAVRRHGDAGTGRFGMRVMWRDMPGCTARLADLYPGLGHGSDLLREVFGIDRYVHLRRRDTVAGAVSLVLAQQTGLWHRHADGSERERTAPPLPPEYDHDAIAEAVGMLDGEADGWTSWFAANGVSPLAVTYEELAAEPAEVLRRVLDHLGVVSRGPVAVLTAPLASSTNDAWIRRFRRTEVIRRLP